MALAAHKGHEYAFGDYGHGRYAWEMTDVRLLEEPVLAKGMQGLWNWEEQAEQPCE
ncbi:hypothetical protein J15TS10_16490 [Paenibacillus woosongensis]|uniref:Uncharacterized protein n=1 Tax=Paenibacillus woosongensis TaxID=307580 RepID=A0ABQ4MR07_9BACL|nr:hypothetical protein [Paenibacillus woosongensis]GIP57835.1 hypothetical protein J15TS10_16490 [Paenibacillus woosongensis]